MKKLLCLLLAFSGMVFGRQLTLVEDGLPRAGIVLPENPVKSAQMGALELRHHVKLITGAELPVGHKAVAGRVNIFIGGRDYQEPGEKSEIRFEKDNIYLQGKDSPVYGKVDYRKYRTFPAYEYQYNGSLFSVYDFLERACGVRFYGIKEADTAFTPCKTLKVKAENYVHSSGMDAFREVNPDGFHAGKMDVTMHELSLWRLRWRMSTYFGKTNHNMESIFFYYYKPAKTKYLAPVFREHRPQYFAQGYEGLGAGLGDWLLRMNYPQDKDVPPQLCYTDSGVSDFYAKEVLEYAAGRNVKGGWGNKVGTNPTDKTVIPRFPGKPFFYPIEGADNGSFCKCPRCRKILTTTQNCSDLKFGCMSEIARKAALKDPGAGVSTLAYIQSLYYPEHVRMPENLSVQLCLTVYSWWHPASYKRQHDEYKKWIRNEAGRRPLTLWTYLFSTYWDRIHYGLYKPFPGFYPWKTGKIFREFINDGIRGWFTEVELNYNMLEAYVAARMCYDSSVDPDDLIDEYFKRYYGKAGRYMKAFYREVEKAYWNADKCPREWLKDLNRVVGPAGEKHPFWGTGFHSPEICWQMGTDARMKKLDGLMKKARKALSDDPVRLERLARFDKMIWQVALEGKKENDLLKSMPRQNTDIAVPRIPDAGGDMVRKVDWSKAYCTEPFTDALGRQTDRKCLMQLAMDSEYLYVRIRENAAPVKGKMLWRENVEMFFAPHKGYPVYQIGIAPFGEKAGYHLTLVNDSMHTDAYDFQEIIVSRPEKDRWELMVAFPLKRLPFDKGKMTANFFRTWGAHGKFSVWAPTLLSHYIGGLQHFGTLRKPEIQK